MERKLYPHPPMGPDIWLDANGDVDPKGTAWIHRVKQTWKGRVYVMGQYATISKTNRCSAARLKLNRAPQRRHLGLFLTAPTDHYHSIFRYVLRFPS